MKLKKENTYIPIQMIGTQRSGSNLLRLMLNELDDIVSPHPPHILERFLPLLPGYGDLEVNSNFIQLIDDVCKLVELNPVPWKIELDRKKVLSSCRKHSLIEITKVLYESLAEHTGKKYWCCKSLANVHFIDMIEGEGLKPFYIYIYRDGRDVATSFKKAIVGEKHIYFIAKQWKKEQELALFHCDRVGKSRAMMIKYEDFIQNPEKTMMNLCEWLNVRYNDRVMHYYESTESKSTAKSCEMWKNVAKPVIKNNFNKYLSELTDVEIDIFECIAGDTLNKLGYSTRSGNNFNSMIFSDTEIEEFRKLNEELKSRTFEHTPKNDLLLRKHQSDLINGIKKRFE